MKAVNLKNAGEGGGARTSTAARGAALRAAGAGIAPRAASAPLGTTAVRRYLRGASTAKGGRASSVAGGAYPPALGAWGGATCLAGSGVRPPAATAAKALPAGNIAAADAAAAAASAIPAIAAAASSAAADAATPLPTPRPTSTATANATATTTWTVRVTPVSQAGGIPMLLHGLFLLYHLFDPPDGCGGAARGAPQYQMSGGGKRGAGHGGGLWVGDRGASFMWGRKGGKILG